MAAMAGTTSMYAGFWRRVAAALIDGLLLSVVTVPLTLAFGDDTYADAARSSAASSISVVVTWLYSALMESSAKQATVGKMALGMIVTDMEGRRIGFGKATGRHFAKILSALILGIGFIMVAFTQRKQGLHDILAGTLVIRGKLRPSLPPPSRHPLHHPRCPADPRFCSRRTGRTISHGDDDLPSNLSRFQVADRLGNLAQGERPVDDRRELPGFDELLQDDQAVPGSLAPRKGCSWLTNGEITISLKKRPRLPNQRWPDLRTDRAR